MKPINFATAFSWLLLVVVNAVPPPPVQNIQIDSVGVDYFVVKWDKYLNKVYGFQVEYHIYPQTAASESNTAASDADSFNVTNVFSATTYQVRVRPIGGIDETANEYGPWSVFVTLVTKGPSPPSSLSISNIMDTKASLAWTPSVSKVDSYQLFVQNSENLQVTNHYTVSSDVNEFLLEMLTPSTPYTVFVSALLNDERSSYLSGGFRTNIARPAAPNNLQLNNILETTADLNWVDPQNGQDISSYEIEVSNPQSPENLTTFSSTSLHYTLIGLKMGTYYICRVRSITVVANVMSDWSSELGFKTLSAAIPPSPTSVVISNVTTESATVTWSTPLTPYPINNYIILYYISKMLPVSVKVAGDVNSYVLTNLASGTQYSTMVQAVIFNDVLGEFSVENIFVTSGPKPVSSVTITGINDSSANVSWDVSGQNYSSLTVVLFDNGLKMKTAQKIFTQNVLHYTFTNLTPNNPYIVKVVIIDENNVSSSEASNGFRTGLPLDALNAPSNPSVSILSPSSVLFQCDKVSWAIKYQISIEGNPNPAVPINRTDEFSTTLDSSLIQKMQINDLISGYPYNLRVRGVFGDNGYVGQWSTVATFSLYGGRPPSYIDITDIDENSAIVHWTPGYDQQTSNQVDVKYFIRLEGTEAKNSWVNATFAVPQGYLSFKFPDALISNAHHKVSIFAEKDDVNGTASVYEFKTGNVPPRAVFYPKIKLYENKTTLSWEGIYERPDIIYYEISLLYNYPRVTKTATFKTPDANTTSYEFFGLEQGIVYYTVVRAVVSSQNLSNSKGVWSTPQLFTPKVLLATPENVVVFEADASAKFEWSVMDSAGIFYFEVELSTSDLSTVIVQRTKGSSSAMVIESLVPKTYYQFRVRAIGFNDNAGEWSALGGFVTQGETVFKRVSQTSNRANSGVIVGVTIGIIGVIIALVIGVNLWKRKYKPTKFKQFDTSVKFSKNKKKSYTNGERTLAEMEDPSFAVIKNENKLYV